MSRAIFFFLPQFSFSCREEKKGRHCSKFLRNDPLLINADATQWYSFSLSVQFERYSLFFFGLNSNIYTYAECNDDRSNPVSIHKCHFCIVHVQHIAYHMVVDRISFQRIQDYNDICPIHKYHSVHSPGYKRLL